MLATNPALMTAVSNMSPQQQQVFMAAFTSDPAALLSDPTTQAMLQNAGVTMDPSQLQVFSALAGTQLPRPPLAFKQKTTTLGVRYEFLANTALKMEYQEVEPQDESWGLFREEPQDKVRLLSFAIDVAF